MSNYEHRGHDIKLDEAGVFSVKDGPEHDYTVQSDDGTVVFRATSKFGVTYAGTAPAALDEAKKQVDRALG